MSMFKQILNESSLSRVYQHTQDRNIGVITAHRAENTKQENDAYNEELESHIKKQGFGFVKVKGKYIENHGTPEAKTVTENSFLVMGKKGHDSGHLEGFLKKMGQKYNQDSVLHKPHDSTKATLHGTKESGYPGLGNKEELGDWHPNRYGEFHTKMRGTRSFAFKDDTKKDLHESFQFVVPVSFSTRKEVEF